MQIRNKSKIQKLVGIRIKIYRWNNFLYKNILISVFKIKAKFKKKISISKDDKYESIFLSLQDFQIFLIKLNIIFLIKYFYFKSNIN